MSLEKISEDFGNWAKMHQVKLVTAESCTAGLIAATVAMTSGSSAWLDSGYIVYTPEAKNELLGVDLKTIEKFNITSEEVASEMAYGALDNTKNNLSIAVTGVAGPNGGTNEIPVGTVCMCWMFFNNGLRVVKETKIFEGTRNQIREAVVEHVLNKAMELTIKK